MSTQTLSLALLIGRAITVVFVILTLRFQTELVKLNNLPDLQWYRKLMLYLTTALLLGNIIPIIIDTYGVFGKGSFNLLLLYVFSNNLTAMLAAFITWLVYYYSRKR